MAGQTVYLDFITPVEDDRYKLEGYMGGRKIAELADVKLIVGDTEYDLRRVHREQHQEGLELDSPIANSTFEVIVQLSSTRVPIDFACPEGVMSVKMNRFTGLSRLLFSSRRIGRHAFVSTGRLSAMPARGYRSMGSELLTMLSILVNWRLIDVYRRVRHSAGQGTASLKKELLKAPLMVAEAVVTIPVSIALRIAYFVTRGSHAKELWLVSDRHMAAGDNGEVFFRYVMAQKDKRRDVRFVLSRRSADYARVSRLGPVVEPGSLRHKLLQLHADKVVSSQADIEVFNPYVRQQNHFLDLLGFDFVFLQHGIIRHDLSNWLNRFNRNISLFITSSRAEYQSILDNNYYYSKENVLLSGLPRYDLLESNPKGKLILAPTYRANLLRLKTNAHGERGYDGGFKKTEYFQFYNRLMTDSRVLDALRAHAMTGELYLHPVFAAQRGDFTDSEQFRVMEFPYDYTKAFREGNLLVSDHSSVVFDFAYLKKPVLYAHFDVDTFYDGHIHNKSASFSDEANGFGEVCYDYESLVSAIIRTIRGGCNMKPEYQKRVDEYFYKVDHGNCERVYRALTGSN